jgi:hypothetical protein
MSSDSPLAGGRSAVVPEGPAMLGLASDILATLMPDEVDVLLMELVDRAGLGTSKGGTGGRSLPVAPDIFGRFRSSDSRVSNLVRNSALSRSIVVRSASKLWPTSTLGAEGWLAQYKDGTMNSPAVERLRVALGFGDSSGAFWASRPGAQFGGGWHATCLCAQVWHAVANLRVPPWGTQLGCPVFQQGPQNA